MKKLIIAFALVLVLCLAACAEERPIEANGTEAPTDAPEITGEPTAEPVVTEAPTDAPTEEPTAEPTESPEPDPSGDPIPTPGPTEQPVELKPHAKGDYFAEIRHDVPFIADLDGDGEDDTGLVYTFSDEEGWTYYYVSITRACRPDEPFLFDLGAGWQFVGAAVDFYPEKPGLELLLSCSDEGAAWSCAVRMKDDGSDLECFFERFEIFDDTAYFNGIDDEYEFDADEGISIGIRTNILGTYYVRSAFVVNANGFDMLNDEYSYPEPQTEIKLKRDMELTTEDGKTVTAREGMKIVPVSTDLETYVIVRLPDGTTGRADVSFGDPDRKWPVSINGTEQNEYGSMPYAD